MTLIHAVLLDVLARHLGVDVTALDLAMSLERDLDLTPLELVLVSLDVEELEGVQVRPEDLASALTLGELMAVYVRAATRDRPAGARSCMA